MGACLFHEAGDVSGERGCGILPAGRPFRAENKRVSSPDAVRRRQPATVGAGLAKLIKPRLLGTCTGTPCGL